MKSEAKKMTEAELNARNRVARMLIMLSDVQFIQLDGGVCWPLGSFDGGTLVKGRDGRFWLCDAYALAEGRSYERLELPVEAVAAALLGSLDDDELGYDSVEIRIAESTYERLAVHPGELGWWTTEMRDRVIAMNPGRIEMKS